VSDPGFEGEGSHSRLWYLLVGPHVRDIVASLEIIAWASLLEDESVQKGLVGTAAKHLASAAERFAGDPMPAIPEIRQHLM
jgi:hypothetical protein